VFDLFVMELNTALRLKFSTQLHLSIFLNVYAICMT